MDRELLDRGYERGLLAVVLAIVVFGPLATGAVRGQDFAVLQGLTVLGIGLWVVRFWINPSHRLQWPPVCWAVVAFVIYAIVRYRQADVEYVARLELIRVLVYAGLFFLVLNNLHRQETTRILIWTVLALGMGISLSAVYQYLAGSNKVWWLVRPPQYNHRGSGTYICPDHLAGFLEQLLPLALAGLLVSKARAVGRVFYAYIAIVLLAGVGVSLSRGGYVATGVALLVMAGWLVRYRDYRKPVLISLVVMVVASALFIVQERHAQKRFQNMFTDASVDNVRVRPDLWTAAAHMWLEHVWWGVGPGQFDVRFAGYRPTTVQSRPIWVHNDYLNTLADWGAVGSVIVAAGLVCLGAGALKTWKYVQREPGDLSTRRSDRAALVLGASIALLALAIHSVVDFNLHIPANAILATVLAASLTSHLRFTTGRYWVTPHWSGRVLVTGLCLGAIGYLGPHAARRFEEEYWLTRAGLARTAPAQFDALQQAHLIEPANAETVQKIGEIYRLVSWEGGDNWREMAETALKWFDLGMKLNRWETYNFIRYGMCLDWLDEHAKAQEFFDHAVQLDPNSYYAALMRGWHAIQAGNYPAAKAELGRSTNIIWWPNPLAHEYLAIVNQKLATQPPPKSP
jgi:O-antigen ligase